MKRGLLIVVFWCVACAPPNSPTAPTPVAAVTPPVSQPPVVTPPVIISPSLPAFPPIDPRFDLAFYRQFVHGGGGVILRRQSEAPRIYLRTVDDGGTAIDSVTLDQTAAALINTTGALTGAFGLAGMERGTSTREGQLGWITVRWSDLPNETSPNSSTCGSAQIGGGLMTLYPRSRFCRCAGGPAVVLTIVRHELGHALGFYHTDDRNDLMFPTYQACDRGPSAREIYHASVAYTRPVGSSAP